ncbi:hypothetical protein AAFN86_19660 [Roseomonas sp. CAU 1739]
MSVSTDGRFATAEDLTVWRSDPTHWETEQVATARRLQEHDGGVVY